MPRHRALNKDVDRRLVPPSPAVQDRAGCCGVQGGASAASPRGGSLRTAWLFLWRPRRPVGTEHPPLSVSRWLWAAWRRRGLCGPPWQWWKELRGALEPLVLPCPWCRLCLSRLRPGQGLCRSSLRSQTPRPQCPTGFPLGWLLIRNRGFGFSKTAEPRALCPHRYLSPCGASATVTPRLRWVSSLRGGLRRGGTQPQMELADDTCPPQACELRWLGPVLVLHPGHLRVSQALR